MKRLAGAVGVGAVVVLWGEFENWRASHRLVSSEAGASEAVVVLGCRNSGPRANALNRWRVRAGLRSQDPFATTSLLVLCGGGSPRASTEAQLMAEYARESRGYRGDIRLEGQSRSTWENIENAIPLVEDVERIKIVSDPLHAEKGRLYLARQRPDLAVRLVRGADYRFGEWWPLKPAFAAYGLWKLRGAR